MDLIKQNSFQLSGTDAFPLENNRCETIEKTPSLKKPIKKAKSKAEIGVETEENDIEDSVRVVSMKNYRSSVIASKSIHKMSPDTLDENISDEENEQIAFSARMQTLEQMKQIQAKFKNIFIRDEPIKTTPATTRNLEEKNNFNLDFFKNFFFYPIFNEEIYQKHIKLLHKEAVYSLRELKKENAGTPKRVLFCEQKNKKKTLLLDLDDTLIHTCSLFENPEYILTLNLPEGNKTIGVNVRPYAFKLLQKISKTYEIFIFTASFSVYAEAIVDLLDPNKDWIEGVLTRDHCYQTKKGLLVKDLRIIKNRNIKNIILVDDTVHSFAFQINNGIPILKWNNKRNDQELKYLYKYLVNIAACSDVRETIKKDFQLEYLAEIPENMLFPKNN